MFFDIENEEVRVQCFKSFENILEYCFVNKRYGMDNKKAKDLIFQPLYDVLQNPIDRVPRQSACFIIRKLNEKYMQDPDLVNILHSHTITALGIKHKIYDGEFLMAIVDLLNEHGIALTLSECLAKSVDHFIQSVRFNLTG